MPDHRSLSPVRLLAVARVGSCRAAVERRGDRRRRGGDSVPRPRLARARRRYPQAIRRLRGSAEVVADEVCARRRRAVRRRPCPRAAGGHPRCDRRRPARATHRRRRASTSPRPCAPAASHVPGLGSGCRGGRDGGPRRDRASGVLLALAVAAARRRRTTRRPHAMAVGARDRAAPGCRLRGGAPTGESRRTSARGARATTAALIAIVLLPPRSSSGSCPTLVARGSTRGGHGARGSPHDRRPRRARGVRSDRGRHGLARRPRLPGSSPDTPPARWLAACRSTPSQPSWSH